MTKYSKLNQELNFSTLAKHFCINRGAQITLKCGLGVASILAFIGFIVLLTWGFQYLCPDCDRSNVVILSILSTSCFTIFCFLFGFCISMCKHDYSIYKKEVAKELASDIDT